MKKATRFALDPLVWIPAFFCVVGCATTHGSPTNSSEVQTGQEIAQAAEEDTDRVMAAESNGVLYEKNTATSDAAETTPPPSVSAQSNPPHAPTLSIHPADGAIVVRGADGSESQSFADIDAFSTWLDSTPGWTSVHLVNGANEENTQTLDAIRAELQSRGIDCKDSEPPTNEIAPGAETQPQ